MIVNVPTARRRFRVLTPLSAVESSFVPNSALPLAISNHFAGLARPSPSILTSPRGWNGRILRSGLRQIIQLLKTA